MPDIKFTEKAFSEYMDWQRDRQTMKRTDLCIGSRMQRPL